MSLKRMWALFVARNYEFFRDKAGFGWNILFPFLIVAGFGLIFSSDAGTPYKLGIFPVRTSENAAAEFKIPKALLEADYIKIVAFETHDDAREKLTHHKIDLLVENTHPPLKYWINDASPKGRILEKIVRHSVADREQVSQNVERTPIEGEAIRYIDWLFPGILAMNIMFSCLFGVGFVIVRYRRSGVLKRLKATPVTAFEYLSAQMASRLLILFFTSTVVWFGCNLFFSFEMRGSYLDIFAVFLAGTLCLSSIGLLMACRGTNEELANGVINFISWPMMFLSEVWFSIEGSSQWVKAAAQALPLTHFLSAARKIINDGAALSDVSHEMAVLAGMTIVFLAIGSWLFSWTR